MARQWPLHPSYASKFRTPGDRCTTGGRAVRARGIGSVQPPCQADSPSVLMLASAGESAALTGSPAEETERQPRGKLSPPPPTSRCKGHTHLLEYPRTSSPLSMRGGTTLSRANHVAPWRRGGGQRATSVHRASWARRPGANYPSAQAVWVLNGEACPVVAPHGQNQLQVGRNMLRLTLWA